MKTFLTIISSLLFLTVQAQEWPDSLNTAKGLDYLTKEEQEVIFELNKVRSDPQRYAKDVLEPMLAWYSGKDIRYPDEEIINKSQEGVGPLKECIKELFKAEPLPILYPSVGLTKTAEFLAEHQEKTGNMGHRGPGSLLPDTRMAKYGKWQGSIAENIAYGASSPQRVVANLLIDDGVPGRGHRKNILDVNFLRVGIAMATHPKFRTLCVMDFATGFIDR